MSAPDLLDIGSNQLGYRKVGRGPDVVFIHGWPVHRETWRNIVTNLPDYTCHLIDLPGTGASVTTRATKMSIPGHIDALVAAVDKLGLESVALVGHDSGGLIARYVADRLPQPPSALVLAGSEIPFHFPGAITRLKLAARMPGAATVTKRLMNSRRVARSKQLFGGGFWDRDLIEGEFRTEVLDQTFSDTVAVRRQLDVLSSFTKALVDDLAEVHARLTCPTLFIWGEQDPFFPAEKARKMADQFGGTTRFEVIENARLMVHEEHPTQFASLCAEFLSDSIRAHSSEGQSARRS